MIVIFTKPNCPACVRAKQKYPEAKVFEIGKDIERDLFIKLFPEVRSVPLIMRRVDE